VPVNHLNKYLDSAGITPKMSDASRLFAEGLALFGKQ